MVIFFVCFVPVRLLRPNMAVFVPCDCKLQRAYSLLLEEKLRQEKYVTTRNRYKAWNANY